MRHLLGLGAVLGLIACTTGPSTTSLKDLQNQIQAATKAAHDASIQEQAAALRNAGIVNPEEQHTADGVQVVLTTGHVAGIAAVGVSADGRYVISSDQTQVKVWEVASHSEVRSFGAGAGSATMAINFRVTSGSCRVLLAAQSVIGTQSLRDCVTGNEIANAQLISEDGNSTVTDAMTRMREVGMSIRPNDSGLLIRDLVVGKQSNIPAPDGSTALGISANGQTLLTNDFDISAGGWRSTISGVAGLAGGIAQAVPGVGLVAASAGTTRCLCPLVRS